MIFCKIKKYFKHIFNIQNNLYTFIFNHCKKKFYDVLKNKMVYLIAIFENSIEKQFLKFVIRYFVK